MVSPAAVVPVKIIASLHGCGAPDGRFCRYFVQHAPGRSSVASSQQAKIVAFCAMSEPSSDALRAPVSASYARALLRHFGRTDSERDELLKGTGIRQQILSEPGADMPVSSLVVLAANITRRHGEL